MACNITKGPYCNWAFKGTCMYGSCESTWLPAITTGPQLCSTVHAHVCTQFLQNIIIIAIIYIRTCHPDRNSTINVYDYEVTFCYRCYPFASTSGIMQSIEIVQAEIMRAPVPIVATCPLAGWIDHNVFMALQYIYWTKFTFLLCMLQAKGSNTLLLPWSAMHAHAHKCNQTGFVSDC